MRILGALLLGVAGYQFGSWLVRVLPLGNQLELGSAILGATLGGLTGYLYTVPAVWSPFLRVRRRLASMAAGDLVTGGLGLLLGLLVTALITVPLSRLPGFLGNITPVLAAIAVTYIAVSVLLARHRELAEYVTERKFLSGAPRKAAPAREREKYLLDTSAIIDGRIADVAASGFLSGALVAPQFVLRELQAIADSPGALRRNRGRRGLDMLARLQEERNVPVEILDVPGGHEDVDGKLVEIAREHGWPIITNDYNLNKVAALQGVKILNINELSQALKPVLLPGEDVNVRIIQEGKEFNQGVGYLDDGTMVVVENGRRSINNEVDVTVTRVLQTMAGRMIFAQLNSSETPQRHN